MPGEVLTHWTIRLALLCYAAVLAGEIIVPAATRRSRPARLAWTAGCALFLAHVACAFQYYHHWSHAEAYADTALRTGELIGWRFGAGIFFSYAFGVVWAGDVAWWWAAPRSYAARPGWLGLLVHAYLFFIAVNGAIVFEDGPTRWVGSAAVLGLLLLLAMRILGRRETCVDAAPAPPPPAASEPGSQADA